MQLLSMPELHKKKETEKFPDIKSHQYIFYGWGFNNSGNPTIKPGIIYGQTSSVEKRFKDIWQSDHYWEVMNYLSGPNFNAQNMCAALCLQHKVNEILDNHMKGYNSSD